MVRSVVVACKAEVLHEVAEVRLRVLSESRAAMLRAVFGELATAWSIHVCDLIELAHGAGSLLLCVDPHPEHS